MTALLPFLLLVTAPAPAPDDAVPHPLRLNLWSTSAFGVTHAKFFNQLAGARLDYRFTSRFAFGASFAYANLEGKDGRVHNVLPEVSTEYRVPLQKEAYGMPLRLGLGFLPKNLGQTSCPEMRHKWSDRGFEATGSRRRGLRIRRGPSGCHGSSRRTGASVRRCCG